MKLTIVSGTLNRKDGLERLVTSVKQGVQQPHRLLIGDAGSTDGTIEWLESQDYAEAVLQGKKLGFPKAYNDLIARSETEYTGFMADDAELVPGAMDLGTSILDSRPDVGAVILKMEDMTGSQAGRPYLGAVTQFGILTGNHILARTSILRQIGGFHEEFRWYYADTDMTAAILAAGHRIVLTKPVCVKHYRDYTTDSPERLAERGRNTDADYGIYRARFNWIPRPNDEELRRLMLAKATATLLWDGAKERDVRMGWTMQDFTNWAYMRWINHNAELAGSDQPYYFEQFIPESVRNTPLNPYALAKRGERSMSGSAFSSSSIPSRTEVVVR